MPKGCPCGASRCCHCCDSHTIPHMHVLACQHMPACILHTQSGRVHELTVMRKCSPTLPPVLRSVCMYVCTYVKEEVMMVKVAGTGNCRDLVKSNISVSQEGREGGEKVDDRYCFDCPISWCVSCHIHDHLRIVHRVVNTSF